MRRSLVLPASLALTLAGCGSYGSYGVTPGGVQDMSYARDLISNGLIPGSVDYTVEGLFSEHDLPLDGGACADTLCPRAAAARIDTVDGAEGRMLLQLGFATDITEQDFQRPPLNLSVAIDISGSMDGAKLNTSKGALLEVVDQLDAGDRMALITYGNTARVAQELTVMDKKGRDKMRKAIHALSSKGSTAMEDGLEQAIAVLEGIAGKPGVEDRIFLLTDAQPNVGATGVGSFVGLTRKAANQDIGLTVWGVGLDLGSELVTEMSSVRGGNAYYFVDVGTMRSRVRDELDLMVTPIAYDVAVYATPDESLVLDRAWGAPTDDDQQQVDFGTSTLFLSKRDGGMGVTLAGAGGQPIPLGQGPATVAALEISWLPVDATQRESATLSVGFDGGTAYADDRVQADALGVYKMAALIDEVLALDAGAALCEGLLDPETATAQVTAAATRMAERSAQLHDIDLQIESDLLDQLLLNVEGGSGNCATGTASLP